MDNKQVYSVQQTSRRQPQQTSTAKSTVPMKTSSQGRRRKKKKHTVRNHMKRLGFTNRLAVYIMIFLAAGLAGGFYLAMQSIKTAYTGALMCWTVVFTPIGTACSIVLSRIVEKSRAENTSASGDGIKYAAAKIHGFIEQEDSWQSPAI